MSVLCPARAVLHHEIPMLAFRVCVSVCMCAFAWPTCTMCFLRGREASSGELHLCAQV